tara:strand:+ start:207 stop:1088 length:882 start_codon:yes stop_codon:yes gene_type:complete
MAMTKKEVDGFKWNLDVNDGGISRVLNSATTEGRDFSFARERIFMNTLDTTIKPGMVCIDLGANIGYATMFMLRNAGPTGYVYAIEPDNHNLDILTKNIKENDYDDPSLIETTRCLITDYDGESPFWIANQPNLNSVKKTKHSIRQETIPCFSLSTYCKDRKYPNFIKMDIEGHEVSVFNGAYEYFKKNRGETHFLLEVHAKMYDKDNDFAKTLHKYEEIGFKISKLIATPERDLAPFSRLGYTPDLVMPSDGWIRSLYTGVDNAHAIDICTKLHDDVYGGKAVRAIMVSRNE